MRLSLITVMATFAAAPAFAADLGTYRPGTPYHSTIVPDANVCQSQCSGDARCRGWNYVKAAPKAPGVCEFQSTIGAPVSSAISISGVNDTAGPVSSRIVQGDTNTIRVGTSTPPQRAEIQTQPTQRVVQQQAPTERRIVREPVPQQAAPSHHTARFVQPHPQARPQFQPMLDAHAATRPQNRMQPQAQHIQQSHPSMMAPPQSRGPARASRVTGQRHASMPRQLAPQAGFGHPPQTRPAYNGRPPIGQTIAPPASYVPPQPVGEMPRASAANPVTFEGAANSLYGSLNDDVRVPASNSAIPTDPNAPIPTASARPVAPIQQGLLGAPTR